MRIFIVGPMASGKSTLGKKLAQNLGIDFIDIDEEIEKTSGVDISWIFDIEGEDGFRKRERKVLKDSLKKENVVISTGGGIITVEENRRLMSSKGKIIYLKASVELQLKRTKNDKSRPLLSGEDKETTLKELKKVRDPLYEEISDITIYQNKKNYNELIREITKKLRIE